MQFLRWNSYFYQPKAGVNEMATPIKIHMLSWAILAAINRKRAINTTFQLWHFSLGLNQDRLKEIRGWSCLSWISLFRVEYPWYSWSKSHRSLKRIPRAELASEPDQRIDFLAGKARSKGVGPGNNEVSMDSMTIIHSLLLEAKSNSYSHFMSAKWWPFFTKGSVRWEPKAFLCCSTRSSSDKYGIWFELGAETKSIGEISS